MQDRTCDLEGCDRKTRSPGSSLCAMHYHRRYRHGSTEMVAQGSGISVSHGRRYRSAYLPSHPLAMSNGKVYVHRAVLYGQIGTEPVACRTASSLTTSTASATTTGLTTWCPRVAGATSPAARKHVLAPYVRLAGGQATTPSLGWLLAVACPRSNQPHDPHRGGLMPRWLRRKPHHRVQVVATTTTDAAHVAAEVMRGPTWQSRTTPRH